MANNLDYRYETPQVKLDHIYGISSNSGNNVVWDKERKRIIYSCDSTIILEALNPSKAQKLIQAGNDPIWGIELSDDGRRLLAFTRTGGIDGTPMIYIWEASTLSKICTISIDQPILKSATF